MTRSLRSAPASGHLRSCTRRLSARGDESADIVSDGEYQADAVTTRDWQGLVVAPELILDFLRTFSRFEFALKAAGFADGDEQRVAPAWDRFGRVIAAQVDALADAEFAASAR